MKQAELPSFTFPSAKVASQHKSRHITDNHLKIRLNTEKKSSIAYRREREGEREKTKEDSGINSVESVSERENSVEKNC